MIYKIASLLLILAHTHTIYTAAVHKEYDFSVQLPYILTTPARQRHAQFIEYMVGQRPVQISTDDFDKAVRRCEILYKILQAEVRYKNCVQNRAEQEEPDIASLPENHPYKKALVCALSSAYQQALHIKNHMPDLCIPGGLSQELPERTSVLIEGDNGLVVQKHTKLPALWQAIKNAEDQLGGENTLNSPRYHTLKEILTLSNSYAFSESAEPESPVGVPCSHVDLAEDCFCRDMIHIRYDTAEKMLGYLTAKITRE